MKIIITESQKRIILTESLGDKIETVLKQSEERTKTIVDDIKEQVQVNVKFLLTWGAGIGGFVSPVADFLEGEYPNLQPMDVSLILTAIIFTYFTDNEESLKNLKNKIEEKGLTQILFRTLSKTDELYEAFFNFMKSLGKTFQSILNMLSYTFIIPILPLLYRMITSDDINVSNYTEIAERIAGFSTLTISGVLFGRLLKRLIKRFKTKK